VRQNCCETTLLAFADWILTGWEYRHVFDS
jgi:hypothetical protein